MATATLAGAVAMAVALVSASFPRRLLRRLLLLSQVMMLLMLVAGDGVRAPATSRSDGERSGAKSDENFDGSLSGRSVVDLGGLWDIVNSNGSVSLQGVVPGNVHTALSTAGLIGDPYYRFNDVDYRWIVYDSWTYSRTFTVTAEQVSHLGARLLCDGLDTVSAVYVNNVLVGKSDNQFINYAFDVTGLLQEGDNTLRVAFMSAVEYSRIEFDSHPYLVPPPCPPPEQFPECHANFIRKAQCSFSWDWGPAFPTQGIWKRIALETFDTAVIRDVTPFPLRDVDGSWRLNVSIYFDLTGDVTGRLRVELQQLGAASEWNVTLTAASKSVTVELQGLQAASWWPRGYGQPTLYDLTVTFTPNSDPTQPSVVTTKTGFRTVELVQDPMTEGLTFYFRINDVPVFMKGSNWIPVDSFLDTITYDQLRKLLESAVDVNMNSIRIWGGGVYESDDFYDIADELGILVWQDMMFACSLYQTHVDFLASVSVEITSQIKRLSRHPSIVAWTANNENEGALVDNWYGTSGPNYELYKDDYVILYIDTVRAAILDVDPFSRPFLGSSPTNGKVTEENGWISESPRPSSPLYGDVHYYNYVGDCLDYNIFPKTRYASEYGYQSWPSYSTLVKVADPAADLYYGSEFFVHREHHAGAGAGTENIVRLHFNWTSTGDRYQDFKNYIYLTQAAQAACYKSESEFYRRSRSDPNMQTMGALYWQHNDIWQAPTWATIDHDGNWKMAHYFAARFFADPVVSVVDEPPAVAFYAVTDSLTELPGVSLVVRMWSWSTLTTPLFTWTQTVDVLAAGSQKVFEMSRDELLATGNCPKQEQCLMTAHLQTTAGDLIGYVSEYYFVSWKYAEGLLNPNVQVTEVFAIDASTFSVTVRTDAVTTFTWLEAVDVKGRFSDNGFLMTQSQRTLTFHAWQNGVTADGLKAAIAVTTLYDVM